MRNKSASYNFFATQHDISNVLRAVEAAHPLQYIEAGLFDESERPVFQGFASVPELGRAQVGDSNLEPIFLVLLKGARLTVRTVPQRRGGTKYAVDQLANAGSVVIRPGGKYDDATLISGMVGTVHHDKTAEMLIEAFSHMLHRDFTKVKSYFVGREAMKLHHTGMRLTKSLNGPKEFDLSAQTGKPGDT